MLRDRVDAGARLAQRLAFLHRQPNAVVLALPRGGVVVGAEIAGRLQLPLDVLIVRKLGLPWHPELAMGAIASGGIRILNHQVVRAYGVTPDQIEEVADAELAELQRREHLYRGDRPLTDYRGYTIILTDDGIATGSTLQAALAALQAQGAARIYIAVGVAPLDASTLFTGPNVELVALLQPASLDAISCWYQHFPQTTDEEVIALMRSYAAPPCQTKG